MYDRPSVIGEKRAEVPMATAVRILDEDGEWYVVRIGDVVGWTEALRWFDKHPEEASAMGRRASALGASDWNYRLFSAKIDTLLRSVATGG